MKETAERRMKMLELLCERRKIKVDELAEEFNVSDEDKIKLSIGEASRMLLRKEPELILIKNMDNVDLKHIIRMANDKGIKIVPYDKSDYECIAIIK